MKILTKKIFREIRFNKFRSAIIILTIFVAVSLGLGFINLKSSADASVAINNKKLNHADLRVRLNNFISQSELSKLLTESEKSAAGITDIEGRIFNKDASVIYEKEDYDAYLIGSNLIESKINKLHLLSGTNQLNTTQVLVEQHFGGGLLISTGAKINEYLTINFMNRIFNVSIGGFVADSEYLYAVNEQTGIPTYGDICVIYMSLDVIYSEFNLTGYNEILIKTKERSHTASQIADQTVSNAIGEDRIHQVIYWDETADMDFFRTDNNANDKMGVIFGLFGLITGSIAIYNSLSKLVMAQRTHIGLYGALGARKRDIFYHYIGFGMTLGIIGTFLGWMGAALISSKLVEWGVRVQFGLVYTDIGLDPVLWIGGSLLTLAVVFVFSFLSVLPILNMTPYEALRAPYSISELGKESFLERIVKPLRVFRKLISKIPLRTIFMNKKRSLSTALVIAASMVILVTSGSLIHDFMLGIERNYTEYEMYDVQVILKHPASEQSIKKWIHQNISEIQKVEGIIFTQVWVGLNRVPLQAFHQNSTLRDFHLIKGNIENKESLGKDSLLIGKTLANDLGVKVGDQLNITFDQNNSFKIEVAGITGELYDKALLWTIEGLQQLTTDIQGIGIQTNVTGFIFTYDDNFSAEDKTALKLLIQDEYPTHVYIDTNEGVESLKELMASLTALLGLVALLGILTLTLFTFSSMSLAMMGREMEFLALRAMGAKRRSILKVLFLENFLYGILGLIIGIPISMRLLGPTYSFLLADMYIPVVVPVELWIVVVGIVLFCVLLSTGLLAWKTWRSSLPDMLYNRMVS